MFSVYSGIAFEAIKKIRLGKGGLFKVPRFFWHTCEYGHSVYSVWFSGTGGGSNTWSLCFSSNSQLCAAKSCGYVSRDTVRSWGGHALMELAGCTPAVGHGDAGSFVAERLKRFDICLYQSVSRPFYKHDFQHRLNMFLCPLKTRTAFIKPCIFPPMS